MTYTKPTKRKPKAEYSCYWTVGGETITSIEFNEKIREMNAQIKAMNAQIDKMYRELRAWCKKADAKIAKAVRK